jgi:CTP:molybdopterin cytidylyltransferase MocA
MGRPKPLLLVGDRPSVVRCLEALRHAGVAEVVVVVAAGAVGDAVARAVTPLGATVATNPNAGSDMAGSIRVALAAADPSASGVLVALCDYPLVAPGTVSVLRAEHALHPDAILVPVYEGRKGHPTLFPRAILEEIAALPTLRDVVWKDPARVREIDVRDEGVVLEMDTPEEYARLLSRLPS